MAAKTNSSMTHKHEVSKPAVRKPSEPNLIGGLEMFQSSASVFDRSGPSDVLALQRIVGNRTVGHLLQRAFKWDKATNDWLMTFTVGKEIDYRLAEQAFERTRNGPLDDQSLAKLRKLALDTDRSIDDNERMFLAALLDGQNAAHLHKTYPNDNFGYGDSITFRGSVITEANRERVRDFGRESETSLRLGERADQRILRLAEQQFSLTAQRLVQLAGSYRVPYQRVYEAMLAAASDSTPGDRVLAGAAYVIAKHAQLPVADDLLQGNIKVDEVPPANIRGTAEYVANSTLDQKGDTVYLPTNFDIDALSYQGLLVHELTHAASDKAASGQTFIPAYEEELKGYRAQGRYWLNHLRPLKGARLTSAIAKLAPDANKLSVLAMLVENDINGGSSSADNWILIEKINNASPNGLSQQDFSMASTLPTAQLEQLALHRISQTPPYAGHPSTSVQGLRGESFLDE